MTDQRQRWPAPRPRPRHRHWWRNLPVLERRWEFRWDPVVASFCAGLAVIAGKPPGEIYSPWALPPGVLPVSTIPANLPNGHRQTGAGGVGFEARICVKTSWATSTGNISSCLQAPKRSREGKLSEAARSAGRLKRRRVPTGLEDFRLTPGDGSSRTPGAGSCWSGGCTPG